MSTHRCPVSGCKTQVRRSYLMCGYHWRLVPRDAARRLYSAWNDGAGYGTSAHVSAMDECVRLVEANLARSRP